MKKIVATRKIFALLICAVMLSALIPSAVLAATGIYVGGTELIEGTYYINDGDGGITETGATSSNYNVYYNSDILTLRNANITKNYSWNNSFNAAIYAQTDLEINLINDNELSGGNGGKSSNGIFLSGFALTIAGTGRITVTGGVDVENGSFGIFASTFTMNGGSLTATGGDNAKNGSQGIYATTFTMNGGSLTATGGNNAKSGSRGIYAATFTMNGGSLTATGGDNATFGSNGIYADTITMNGGSIIAKGNNAAISTNPNLSDTKCNYTITASENISATPIIEYVEANINSYKYVNFTPAISLGTTHIAQDTYYINDGDGGITKDGATEANYNVLLAKESSTGILTLTLRDANITENYTWDADGFSHTAALYCGIEMTIELFGENKLTGASFSETVLNKKSYGLFSPSSVEIKGDGSLTVDGGAIVGTNCESYGVYANGSVTINSGSLTANGNRLNGTNVKSYGVYANESVTITGGSLTANGKFATYSYGVYVNKDINITGGSLTVDSGSANIGAGGEGYGVYVTENFTISSSGSSIAVMRVASDAIALSKKPVLKGAHAANTITASVNKNGTSSVTYNEEDNSTYKYVCVIPPVFVGETTVTDNKYYLNDGPGGLTEENASIDNYNVSYIDGVLTLKGANITKNYTWMNGDRQAAIYAIGDLTINLINANMLSCADSEQAGYGIYMKGNHLTILGSGSLSSAGGNADLASFGICGINITINGGNITATGGDCQLTSYGIYSGKSITIKGGNTTATGGVVSNNNGKSYGVYTTALSIFGDSLTAKGNTMALSQMPSEFLAGSTFTASTDINGTPSEDYVAARNDEYKYFRIESNALTIAGKPMKPGDYYVNGENGADGEVSSVEPEAWNAKLELIEGEYTLTLDGLNIDTNKFTEDSEKSGIKSYVDLNLHIATTEQNKIIIRENGEGPAFKINGNLVVSGQESEGALPKIICYSYTENCMDVQGDLTISDGNVYLDLSVFNNGRIALKVGGDLNVGPGGRVYSIRLDNANSSSESALIGGDVLMNGELLSIFNGNGKGLQATGSITVNSGYFRAKGNSGALNKAPDLSGYSPEYYWTVDERNYYTSATAYEYDADHKFLEISVLPTAEIEDVSVSGTVNAEITPAETDIYLTYNSFYGMNNETDVTDWFTNIPDGITAKLEGAVEEYDTVVTVTFSGTPTEINSEEMIVTIPADVLTQSIETTIEENENAKWEIASNITSVSVSPETVDVAKGRTQTFTATVAGTNDPDETVTWSVEGGIATTTIDEDGLLTIAATETATSLTVKATSTFDNTKFGTATVTVAMRYPIIKGALGKWTAGGTSSLGFTADADYEKLESVEVDGELLSSDDYTTESGSTIVTLNNAFLKTLTAGRHTLRVNFTDGYSQTYFYIASDNPTTGDGNDYLLWICIAMISGIGISLGYLARKRRANG